MKTFLLILSLLLSSHLYANEKTILVFGDSLSSGYGIPVEQGWVNLLQERLRQQGRTNRVVNASIAGETTQGGLSRLPEAMKRYHPDILILELGANDGLRGFTPTVAQTNLSQIIEQAERADCRVLLLGMQLPPNFGKAYSERFHGIYTGLAERYQLTLIPFFLEGVADRPKWMQADNLHPNAAGQSRLLENVWPALASLL